MSGVSFRLVPGGGKANNIYITFLARLPDDPDGNILARALPPSPGENTGSDIEFDSREPWVPKWTPAFTGESNIQQMMIEVIRQEKNYDLQMLMSEQEGSCQKLTSETHLVSEMYAA